MLCLGLCKLLYRPYKFKYCGNSLCVGVQLFVLQDAFDGISSSIIVGQHSVNWHSELNRPLRSSFFHTLLLLYVGKCSLITLLLFSVYLGLLLLYSCIFFFMYATDWISSYTDGGSNTYSCARLFFSSSAHRLACSHAVLLLIMQLRFCFDYNFMDGCVYTFHLSGPVSNILLSVLVRSWRIWDIWKITPLIMFIRLHSFHYIKIF